MSTARARVSSAVMTHPVRRVQAQELCDRLGLGGLAVDPEPDGPPSALRTALVAWSRVADGATHQLMIQDDVAAPDDFVDLVSHCADRFPADALAYYTNWHARNGAAARLAALAGAGWVRAVPEEFTPTLAIVLPVATADAFRRHAAETGERHDDEVMAGFLAGRGSSALLAVPTVTEHTGTSSINGHGAVQGIRLAVCPTSSEDARPLLLNGWVLELEQLDWLPYMRYGEGYVRLPGQETEVAPRHHFTWREALPRTDLGEHAVATALSTLDDRDREDRRRAGEISKLFGESYADELWIHCVLLGRQARLTARRHAPGAPRPAEGPEAARLRRAAVSTVGPAGLPPERRHEAGRGHTGLLADYASAAVSRGEALADSAPPTADRR
ncbi:hypothetical protein AB0G74_21865 [Streptomyces sp. NPDC020875]|uniref:hypothetical protein n=1 Tax=Streptomyces sp. NPDC020875 TaxID=3154898 RepID=UPI0033C8100A